MRECEDDDIILAMVYDCFSFYNELDLLEIRLNVLNEVVDKFVLVEATQTHTGKPKPLYFSENRGRFAAFNDRIIHIVVENFPSPPAEYTDRQSSWMRENLQRNAIVRGLVDAEDNDLIVISDVDEIPRPEFLSEDRVWNGVSVCEQLFMNFYVNYLDYVRPYWRGSKICRYSILKGKPFSAGPHYAFIEDVNVGMTPTRIRYSLNNQVVRNAGWHFSYLGGAEAVFNKLHSVGMEYESRYSLDNSAIEKIIEKGADITGNGGRFFAIPIDSRFPSYLRNNINRYYSLIIHKSDEYFTRTRCARVRCLIRGKLHRGIARLLPRILKPFLFGIYCKLVKSPINQ